MSTSVGTKSQKKQPTSSAPAAAALNDRKFELALLTLENACLRILESGVPPGRDPEQMYWQQSLQNIVTRVSLAMGECKGPRRFHYHYRHRADDDSILSPVLEDPCDMLAQVCRDALKSCRNHLMGMQHPLLLKQSRMLENALQGFLAMYKNKKNGG
ncbi:MAG: hypothetical protein KGJ06_05410 [Pseudomonadota bacterium]|nr:hypothetical protein [Pseudomonadota bacterium]